MAARYSLRQKLGVVLFDLPRYLPRLLTREGWFGIGNRQDHLDRSTSGRGVAYLDDGSSDLHACHVFPSLGAALMKRAICQWPFRFDAQPHCAKRPNLSFVIPHRGRERVPLLIATVRSILAQNDVAIECIVVEQSSAREIDGLPDGVRHIHLPHPTDPESWRKCWAFNVGVREARADIVVCQDSDIPVPADYGSEVLKHIRDHDREVVHLHRFLFHLDRNDTERVASTGRLDPLSPPERVRQGWKGGTLAIRRECYHRIGGFDESFVGWTGEDREFYDRCLTLNGWRHGYLPFVHLWHEPQPARTSTELERNLKHADEVMAIPRDERIARLREKQESS